MILHKEKQGGRKRESNIACSMEAILGAYYLSNQTTNIEKFINEYHSRHREPSHEELFEMRAAFGEGTTVVDVISGQIFNL